MRNNRFVDKTKGVWQGEITDEDAWGIIRNTSGFFSALAEWHEKDKQRGDRDGAMMAYLSSP